MHSSATTKDHLWPWNNPEHSQLLLQLFLLLLFGVSLHLSKQKSPNNFCKNLTEWFLTSVVQSLCRHKKKNLLLCSSEEKRFPFKAIPVMLHSSKFNASGNSHQSSEKAFIALQGYDPQFYENRCLKHITFFYFTKLHSCKGVMECSRTEVWAWFSHLICIQFRQTQ